MISSRLSRLAVQLTWWQRALAATGAVALVFAVDALFDSAALSLPAKALLDESAHLATGLLLLGALVRRPSPLLVLGTALGSMGIDVDHIPLVLIHHGDLYGVPRPTTHSLLTIIVIAGVALLLTARYRPYALGVAFGIATHLIRDMATGGVPLLWPVSPAFFDLPHSVYTALLLAGALLVAWPARETAKSASARDTT
jgi:inner membrane protein